MTGKRRGSGEGSIHKRKDGRWCGVMDLGWQGGRRRRKYVYAKTQREVRIKLRAAMRADEDGLAVRGKRQSLGQFLDRWLQDSVKPVRRPATYTSYEILVRVHIKPALGHLQLVRLGPEEIQAFLRTKRDAGLSPRTVRYLYSILRVALQQALRWKLIPYNPADLVDRPKKESKEPRPLSPEQALQFLDHVADDRLHALWVVALALGLRRGETLGLEWRNVDFDAATVKVERAVQRIDGRLQLVPPKTPRGVRTIPLPSVLSAALREHQAAQEDAREVAGTDWQDQGLVFTTGVGTPLDGRNVARRLDRLLAEANLPHHTFHELRHSCASLLLALGVQPRVVMQTLGHTQIATSMEIYTHVSAALEREAADRMDAFLRRGRA